MAMSVGYLEILAVITFLVLLLFYQRKKHKTFPTNWPVVGMLPGLLTNASRIHESTFELLKESGGTFKFKGPVFGALDYLVTSDPMNVHHIFSRNFANYPKGSEFKNIFEPLGDGIFNSDSESWKAQRKMIQSLINGKFQKFFVKVIEQKVVNGLFPVLERASKLKTELDLQDVFQRFSFDVICLLVLGSDPGSLSEEFRTIACQKAFDDMWEAVTNRHFIPQSWWELQKALRLGTEKKLVAAMKSLDHFVYECISSRRAEQSRRKTQKEDKIKEEKFDLLTAYLEEEEDTVAQMGSAAHFDKYLRDAALNLMVAGRDTISAALTWFFWLLATNPEAETIILQEIKQISEGKDEKGSGFFNTEELSKLIYLHGALCETLRLYPPVHMERKSPTEADILPTGHHVEKNANIMLSFYAMGRMEGLWGKDCIEFKPERWISERGKVLHVPSYKFVAFNAGPRTCLGRDMAFTQMKMIAAAVIREYHIQVVDGHPIVPALSVILHMKHGLKVRVTKRGLQK